MSGIYSACGGGRDDLPLVAGTLRGYRTWAVAPRRRHLDPGQLPLTSVTRREVAWAPRQTATCGESAEEGDPAAHPAPGAGCGCGIYGWYHPEDSRLLPAPVFGVVQASGRILLGEHGFRAERAEVVAVATRNRRVARACAEAGIAVYASRAELVRAHPPEDVSGLLGAPAGRDRPAVADPLGGGDLGRLWWLVPLGLLVLLQLAGLLLAPAAGRL